VGSGTSGRIGALDASECSPTFGTDPETIQYEIAGGDRALTNASEASEDSTELGVCDMAASKGAATVAIICNRGSALAKVAQLAIEAGVDPEVLTGSMRLKAGTAQKIICNMLTTGAMARLGYVYGNMMVNLQLKNEKLNERGVAIVLRIAKVSRNNAETTLKAAAMKMPVAVVMPRSKVSKAKAIRQLKRKHGNVRKAIEAQAVSTYTLCSLDSSY
jgi:N-acetylmuramic acid 6-phosphate etherase